MIDLSKKPVNHRIDSMDMLAPFVKKRLEAALEVLHSKGLNVYVFETYRSPERQQTLYDQGRTTPGRQITSAKPFQSFHQYGLAVDLVFKEGNRWIWDGDYKTVEKILLDCGFASVQFERVHFEFTKGLTWREAYELFTQGGLTCVWDFLEKRINNYKS